MTPTLDELRKLSDAATPGPWLPSMGGYQILTGDSWNTICVFHSGSGDKWKDHRGATWELGCPREADATNAFLAARAVNFVRSLLTHPDPIAAAYLAGQQSMRERATSDVSEQQLIAAAKAFLSSSGSAAAIYEDGALRNWLARGSSDANALRRAVTAAIRALPDAPSDGDPT